MDYERYLQEISKKLDIKQDFGQDPQDLLQTLNESRMEDADLHMQGLLQNIRSVNKQESKKILPEPGFVIKTNNQEGIKYFLNVLQTRHIPAPGSWKDGKKPPNVEEALKNLEASGDKGAELLRFPMAVSEPIQDSDKKGELCFTIDVSLNSTVVKECSNSRELKHFLIKLVIQYVGEKTKNQLSERYKLPKMKYKGPYVQEQNVRNEVGSEPMVSEIKDPTTEHFEEPSFPLQFHKTKQQIEQQKSIQLQKMQQQQHTQQQSQQQQLQKQQQQDLQQGVQIQEGEVGKDTQKCQPQISRQHNKQQQQIQQHNRNSVDEKEIKQDNQYQNELKRQNVEKEQAFQVQKDDVNYGVQQDTNTIQNSKDPLKSIQVQPNPENGKQEILDRRSQKITPQPLVQQGVKSINVQTPNQSDKLTVQQSQDFPLDFDIKHIGQPLSELEITIRVKPKTCTSNVFQNIKIQELRIQVALKSIEVRDSAGTQILLQINLPLFVDKLQSRASLKDQDRIQINLPHKPVLKIMQEIKQYKPHALGSLSLNQDLYMDSF